MRFFTFTSLTIPNVRQGSSRRGSCSHRERIRSADAALAIGGSVTLSLLTACILGLGIPSLLHALKLDPKIAAGPVTLAISDLATLIFYFGIATIFLT
jgi:Mg/Co/Ni transporter MgtE